MLWWLPGVKDQMRGPPLMRWTMTQVCITCVSYVSLIAKHTSFISSHISAAPPPNLEVQAIQEPEDDNVVVMLMSMDEGDDGEMPQKSHA